MAHWQGIYVGRCRWNPMSSAPPSLSPRQANRSSRSSRQQQSACMLNPGVRPVPVLCPIPPLFTFDRQNDKKGKPRGRAHKSFVREVATTLRLPYCDWAQTFPAWQNHPITGSESDAADLHVHVLLAKARQGGICPQNWKRKFCRHTSRHFEAKTRPRLCPTGHLYRWVVLQLCMHCLPR